MLQDNSSSITTLSGLPNLTGLAIQTTPNNNMSNVRTQETVSGVNRAGGDLEGGLLSAHIPLNNPDVEAFPSQSPDELRASTFQNAAGVVFHGDTSARQSETSQTYLQSPNQKPLARVTTSIGSQASKYLSYLDAAERQSFHPIIVTLSIVAILMTPLVALALYKLTPSSSYWENGTPVQTLREQCHVRVPATVARSYQAQVNYTCFDFTQPRSDCASQLYSTCQSIPGFRGNSNAYGLGIRVSLYMQWTVSVVGNHVLPESQNVLANAYILVCLIYCVFAYIYVWTAACTFPQEWTIISQIFFGGFLCVYTVPPEQTCKTELNYQGLTWSLASRYITLAFFTISCLGSFLNTTKNISENPCLESLIFFGISGTRSITGSETAWYKVLFVPFWIGQLVPSFAIYVFICAFLIAFPLEIGRSILDSSLIKSMRACLRGQQPSNHGDIAEEGGNIQRVGILREQANWYGTLRYNMKNMTGLFLIPLPPSAESKKLASIFAKVIGSYSLLVSILNVERIISTNKITGVNSLDSSGQWLAIICSFITCYPVLRDSLIYFLGGQIKLSNDDKQNDLEQGVQLDNLSPSPPTENTHAMPINEYVTSEALAGPAQEGDNRPAKNSRETSSADSFEGFQSAVTTPDDCQYELPISYAIGFQEPDGTWR